MRNIKIGRKRHEGIILVSVLALSAALFFILSLLVRQESEIAVEKIERKRRIKIERIAHQLSDAAEVWFLPNAGGFTSEEDFILPAQPRQNPVHHISEELLETFAGEYPEHEISCELIDLHYPDDFSSSADIMRIPRILPEERAGGGVVRAYYIKTLVNEKENRNASYRLTKNLRLVKSASGELSYYRKSVVHELD
ncbi:MAG: hypothetical protein Q4D58_04230 [Synergistaceae bacterium]|nr:hypothetical protein [Synergistaceae bacterium]